MEKANYRIIIQEFLNQQKPENPITTQMLCEYVVGKTGLEENTVKKAINVNMGRLEKQGLVKRVARGIYAKSVMTPFGKYIESNEVLICKYLLKNGDEVIGYEAGASLLNKMGLVTQMPKRATITTNYYQRIITDNLNVEIRKPVTMITKNNYRYLQFLDVIREMDGYPIDAANPYDIIKKAAKKLGLETDRMIVYARKFYNGKLLGKTVDIMLGGVTL